jgi:hypothetical protein
MVLGADMAGTPGWHGQWVYCPPVLRCCEPLWSMILRAAYPTSRIEGLPRNGYFKQRSCNMSLIALFSEHFWLLFAVAISIAVLRELHLKRD